VKIRALPFRKSMVADTGTPGHRSLRAAPIRRGSATKSIRSAMTTPGSPTATEVACQGKLERWLDQKLPCTA
jgi:hypothetical protein